MFDADRAPHPPPLILFVSMVVSFMADGEKTAFRLHPHKQRTTTQSLLSSAGGAPPPSSDH